VDIWTLYESYSTQESRVSLTAEQRRLLAVCDFRQEMNSGGFDTYLRYWGADTASEALAILPRALGDPWHQVLAEALAVFGTANPSTADERAEVLDGAGEANDVLGLLDTRFFELEGSQDADRALGDLADDLGPWPP
jgi:hypothetical protein